MKKIPLAERLRPETFEEILGKNQAFSKESWLMQSIKNNQPLSILLYGPPGSGKTTFARLYGKSFFKNLISLNGVDKTTSEIKKIIEISKNQPLIHNQTIFFVDEIHRLNKSQQDIFLPYLEDNTFILIAATTENPSFVVNNALLSRLRVITLSALDDVSMALLYKKYKTKIGKVDLNEEVLKQLIYLSSGDARFFFNCIEDLELLGKDLLTVDDITHVLSKKSANYDKTGDGHYQLISALHKSVRGSDPDASLYWLCRMLEAGEDPKYLIRRLIRMASEDIGLADPNALKIAVSTYSSFQILGSHEGELVIAQLVLYLALAPKSNAAYIAFKKAMKVAKDTNDRSPPAMIANKWMKKEGETYIYDHETEFGFSGQNYFPQSMKRSVFYEPKEIGFERDMAKRVKYFQNLRKKLTSL